MYIKRKHNLTERPPPKPAPIRRFLGSAGGLICIGLAGFVAMWLTEQMLFFWVGFVGIVGGLLKWRFSYPSYGNSKTEHQGYWARWW